MDCSAPPRIKTTAAAYKNVVERFHLQRPVHPPGPDSLQKQRWSWSNQLSVASEPLCEKHYWHCGAGVKEHDLLMTLSFINKHWQETMIRFFDYLAGGWPIDITGCRTFTIKTKKVNSRMLRYHSIVYECVNEGDLKDSDYLSRVSVLERSWKDTEQCDPISHWAFRKQCRSLQEGRSHQKARPPKQR